MLYKVEKVFPLKETACLSYVHCYFYLLLYGYEIMVTFEYTTSAVLVNILVHFF